MCKITWKTSSAGNIGRTVRAAHKADWTQLIKIDFLTKSLLIECSV